MSVNLKRVTFALCGFGRAGQFHLNGIRSNPKCHLKYVVDVPAVLDSARSILTTFNLGHVHVCSSEDYEDIVLKDKDVKAIIVATPTYTHEGIVRKAIHYGKDVFCEKPIANSLQVIKMCYQEADKNGVRLFCAFNRRFDSGYYEVWKQIREGKIGKIFLIKSISRDYPSNSIEYLRTASSIFHDSAVHDIDFICWITGEEPCEVYAQGHAHNPEIADRDVDIVAIVMKFPSGIIATVDISRYSTYGYDQRIEVLGDKGVLSVNNPHQTPVVLATNEGINHTPYSPSCVVRYEAAYRNELDHFINCVLDRTVPLRVTDKDTILVSKIADACEESLKNKKPEILSPIK